jgi:hypothetical protein
MRRLKHYWKTSAIAQQQVIQENGLKDEAELNPTLYSVRGKSMSIPKAEYRLGRDS